MAVEGIAAGGVGLIIVTAVFFALATVMIGLRFVARRQVRAVGHDDWMALASYIFLIAVAVCHVLIGGPYGFAGAPSVQFSEQQMKQFLIMLYADNIAYTCCTASVKMSIVLLFRRIFVTRTFKHITAVLLVILTMWWIAVLLTQIFSCTPIEASWIPPKAETCVKTLMFYNAVTISNVIFDFILLLLPMPMVWKLQIDYKKKFQVCGVFLVGAFTCVCSIMRTIMLQQLLESDITGTVWHAGLWTFIECAVGITCSCMPPMAHLFKKLGKKAAESYADRMGSKQIKLSNYGSNYGSKYGTGEESRQSLTRGSQSKSYVEIS